MSGRDHRRRPFWHLRRGPELVSSEIDEELSAHIDLRTEELQARGLPADVARREAIRQFGDLQSTRDYCRQQDMAKDQGMHRPRDSPAAGGSTSCSRSSAWGGGGGSAHGC